MEKALVILKNIAKKIWSGLYDQMIGLFENLWMLVDCR